MRRHFPTAALRLEDVPPAGDRGHHFRFSLFDGYAASGSQDVMVEIQQRAEEQGLSALTLEELRIEHFRSQRAQRHGGGPYGDNDVWELHMDAIRNEMRRRLSEATPTIGVWTGDITRLSVDAIVNAANETLLGGGGVDGAIHQAAGPKLVEACRAIPEHSPGVRCPTGQARITPGFQLPADHVIHAVGPRWRGGTQGEDDALAATYGSIVGLAEAHQLETVAIPAISTGIYGFPAERAAGIAVESLRAWQRDKPTPRRIVLVGYDKGASATLRKALGP